VNPVTVLNQNYYLRTAAFVPMDKVTELIDNFLKLLI